MWQIALSVDRNYVATLQVSKLACNSVLGGTFSPSYALTPSPLHTQPHLRSLQWDHEQKLLVLAAPSQLLLYYYSSDCVLLGLVQLPSPMAYSFILPFTYLSDPPRSTIHLVSSKKFIVNSFELQAFDQKLALTQIAELSIATLDFPSATSAGSQLRHRSRSRHILIECAAWMDSHRQLVLVTRNSSLSTYLDLCSVLVILFETEEHPVDPTAEDNPSPTWSLLQELQCKRGSPFSARDDLPVGSFLTEGMRRVIKKGVSTLIGTLTSLHMLQSEHPLAITQVAISEDERFVDDFVLSKL